jgi:F-type H+-transporting ATPase subunit gamma
MSKLLELRQRIRAVENIQAITRTLATISAAKLSRTRRRAAGLREYARAVREILDHQQRYLASRGLELEALSPLLCAPRPVRRVILLVLTGDRGMCGGYNLAACRLALEFRAATLKAGRTIGLVLKGRKGFEYFTRRRADILHQEGWGRGGSWSDEVERLLRLLLGLYRSGEADAIYVVFTEFHSPVRRRPRTLRLLPVRRSTSEDAQASADQIGKWHHEPGLAGMLEELLAVYLRIQLHEVLLASYASEQGARMITMEEATERADKALQEYRIRHNRLRREAITTDLLGTLVASRVGGEAASAAAPHT